jgi:4-hydroxy-tetrahydrodipicolinate reductase
MMIVPIYAKVSNNKSSLPRYFEVLIDFTRPEATLDYLATCLSANKAMVIGTMGFNGAGLTNLNNAKN